MRAARALHLMLFGLLARSSAPPTAVAEGAAVAAPPAAAWARAHVELPAARLAAHAAAALDAGPLMYAYRAGVHDSRCVHRRARRAIEGEREREREIARRGCGSPGASSARALS